MIIVNLAIIQIEKNKIIINIKVQEFALKINYRANLIYKNNYVYSQNNKVIATEKKSKNIEEKQFKIIKNVNKLSRFPINKNEKIWQIEIPKINLKAKIQEGTEKENLNKYVGHFEETSILYGNIGLAAHNRGYDVNYFENLKLLKLNDIIIYTYGEKSISYKVEKIKIIKDTNWDYLLPTKDNRITLITCVENKPEYRMCVQGKEI